MGAAQSQSACKSRGSIAHPAVSTTLKIGTISVLKVMADFLGRLQRADTGLRAADGEVGLCGMAALAEGDPERAQKGKSYGAAKRSPLAKACQQSGDDVDHGVFPVR